MFVCLYDFICVEFKFNSRIQDANLTLAVAGGVFLRLALAEIVYMAAFQLTTQCRKEYLSRLFTISLAYAF